MWKTYGIFPVQFDVIVKLLQSLLDNSARKLKIRVKCFEGTGNRQRVASLDCPSVQ